MKFSVAKEIILEAFNTTSKAAASKSTIAALEGLLLELNDNKLTITGYNLEIGIRTEIPVTNGENGSTVINARMLCEIVRKMPSGILEFDIGENKTATIKSSLTEFSIMCMRADEYPPVPQPGNEGGFSVPQPLLKSMINQTKYACATTDTKPALTGCKFEISDNVLSVVAVDGIRIALRQENVTFENIDFIVPNKTLEELTHILSDENDKKVTVCIDKNQISFEVGKYTMISRLINGDFLEYRKHLNCDGNIFAEVNCREIIDMLDRAMLVINEKNKSPVRCEFGSDSITMSCTTTLGKVYDKINVKYNGEPITIGFNAKYLLDAFKACDTDKVKVILTGSAVSPVLIVPMEGKEFTFFLLPMRLK